MSKQKEKSATEDFKWITERETASSILTKLAELKKASKYDLTSRLDVSYATVMNYIRKFIDAGLVTELGEVQAERGGKKTLYEPTQKALEFLSEVKPSTIAIIDTGFTRARPSLGLYSLSMPERKDRQKKRSKAQDVLKDMTVDVAIVVNYKGHPIPIMPISTIGGIDQVNALFSDNLNQRIREVAVKIAENLAEAR